MRVALYARVSTERQEKERTIGSQVEALEARASAEGWDIALRCTDDGCSGARLDRPGLDQVRDAAASRSIDAVVVLCPDRLARNYVHQALVFDELARYAGVGRIPPRRSVADDPGTAGRPDPSSRCRVRADKDRGTQSSRQVVASPPGRGGLPDRPLRLSQTHRQVKDFLHVSRSTAGRSGRGSPDL